MSSQRRPHWKSDLNEDPNEVRKLTIRLWEKLQWGNRMCKLSSICKAGLDYKTARNLVTIAVWMRESVGADTFSQVMAPRLGPEDHFKDWLLFWDESSLESFGRGVTWYGLRFKRTTVVLNENLLKDDFTETGRLVEV